MGMYLSKTKKGSLNGAKGSLSLTSFQCAKEVDIKQRAFNITITDMDTDKEHTINLYGDEILTLHRVLSTYINSLGRLCKTPIDMDTVFRQIEHEGKIDIVECVENEEEKTRIIKRFICTVTPQETHGQTKLLAYEILEKLSQ